MDEPKTERVAPTPPENREKKTERILPPPLDGGTVRLAPESGTALTEPKIDDLFEQYSIVSKIGNGGMGVVYLARDKRLGRFVAIKRLNHEAQSVPALRQRFLHEARAVATLSHVHIVHIYALGEDADGPFIVMEYIAGPDDTIVRRDSESGGLVNPNPPLTLDQYVGRHGSLSTDEAVDVLLKIGRAVAYAHSCGVIHRDLKPSNILLDKSGEPKIVDFGLARLARADESKLTVPGEKLLSLGYGAPEQENDASHTDERSDVYGLGALLYFTLTGQNPRYFREQDIPGPLREIVVKALATDKDRRWPSASAFVDALAQVKSKGRVEIPTVKTTWRCKWCDAVNPLTTKYCAECGWDGSEACPECGAETFVGIQYCGNCGADARAYETIELLLRKMRDAFAQQRYERVASYAGRVHGFEPTGPSGRAFLQEVTTLRDEAEKNIHKREQLKEQIPIELRAENYERAAGFIQEFRALSEDKHVFEAEEASLAERTLRRDLIRAKRALDNREWASAERICTELLRNVAPDNREARNILRSIHRHASRQRTLKVAVLVLVLVAVYPLTFPLVPYLDPPPFTRFTQCLYTPARRLYRLKQARVSPYLSRYLDAALPKGVSPEACLAEPASTNATALASKGGLPKMPDEVLKKQAEYDKQILKLANQQLDFQKAWPKEYRTELDALMEQRRKEGDFEGWILAQTERKRFDESETLPDSGEAESPSQELQLLFIKYRKLLADQRVVHSRKIANLCKRYANELTDTQRRLMQEGKMAQAMAVNEEIRRVRALPSLADAESILAAASVASGKDADVFPPAQVLPASETRVKDGETARMREAFEKSLADIAQEAAKQTSEWPEKYSAKLNEVMENYQRAGDFGGWESVREEVSRFEADRSLGSENIAVLTPELAELQRTYIALQNDIRHKRAEKIVAATEKYVKQLQEVQKKLTVAGNMEKASGVNTEIRRVRSRVDFLEAQNELQPAEPPLPPEHAQPPVHETAATNVEEKAVK